MKLRLSLRSHFRERYNRGGLMRASALKLFGLLAGVVAAQPALAYSITVSSRPATYGGAGTVTDVAPGTGDTWQATDPRITCTTGSTASCVGAATVVGTPVWLSAAPANGSTFASWAGCAATATSLTVGGVAQTGLFCRVSTTAAKNVTAYFKPAQYTLTLNPGDGRIALGAPVSATCALAAGCAYGVPAGGSVQLTAVAPPGYEFKSWAGCSSATNVCTVTMNGAKTVSAYYRPAAFSVVVTTKGSGEVTGVGIECPASTCSTSVPRGGALTLTASAVDGSTFLTWFGCTSASGNTCMVTADAAKYVTAYFDPTSFTLTARISGSGAGGTISGPVNVTGVSGASGTTSFSNTYPDYTHVTLTATPDANSVFQSWSGCTIVSGSTCTVTMDAARTVTATFQPLPSTYRVGGMVSGLLGTGLVLQNSGGDDLLVSAPGAFSFSTRITSGVGYAVTVAQQPTNPGQICTVANAAGTVASSDVTNVAVGCSGCDPGETLCGGTCVDVQTDASNCGSCANACAVGMLCEAGACASPPPTCAQGLTLCGSTCVDAETDAANCGSCGTSCAQGSVCRSGSCDLPLCQASLPTSTYSVGPGPYYISLGDLDADGHLDIVTANNSSRSISVLLGNGDGTFNAESRYVLGSAPSVAAVGDATGDGIADVVFYVSWAMWIIPGNGDGTLAVDRMYSVDGFPHVHSIVVTDFTGDANLDLVTAGYMGVLEVIAGDGAGGFSVVGHYSAGTYANAVAVGDLDRDGDPDLVVGSSGHLGVHSGVNVFLGDGAGAIEWHSVITGVYSGSSLVLHDFNNDGNIDLLLESGVRLGNGDATFSSEELFAGGSDRTGYITYAAGDINEDGSSDLVAIASFLGGTVTVALGGGDGTFCRPTTQ